MEIPTDRVTDESSGKNFITRGSAISTRNSTVVTRTSKFFNKINNSNFYNIESLYPRKLILSQVFG